MPAKAAVDVGAKRAKAAAAATPPKATVGVGTTHTTDVAVAAVAGGGRPVLSKRPTHYNGGRIYFAPKKGKFGYFRCYKRTADRVEEGVSLNGNGKDAAEAAWEIALNAIDNDPRPR